MQHKAVHLVILKCVQAHIIDTLISLPRKPHLLKKHNKELYDKLFDVLWRSWYLYKCIHNLRTLVRNKWIKEQICWNILYTESECTYPGQYWFTCTSQQQRIIWAKSKLVISSSLNNVTSRIRLHKLLIIVTNKQISISYLTFTVFMNFKQLEDDELFPPLTWPIIKR